MRARSGYWVQRNETEVDRGKLHREPSPESDDRKGPRIYAFHTEKYRGMDINICVIGRWSLGTGRWLKI